MDDKWSKSEKKIARKAYDAAYQRECAAIIAKVQHMASEMETPKDLWQLDDYLYEQRRDTDEKYDYRYSVLLMVFSSLLNEGWLTFEDLDGLSEAKLTHLRDMVRFYEQIIQEQNRDNNDS
jgi:hypothetical protein